MSPFNVRFVFTATRRPEKGLQLQEVELYDRRGAKISVRTAESPDDVALPRESADQTVDGILCCEGGKWLDQSMRTGSASTSLLVALDRPERVASYAFVIAGARLA